MYARGAIFGLTRGTKREHIIRAAQESIAYQSADLVAAMEKDTGVALKALKADGGASRDGFLMQFQADILNKKVIRPAVHETTARWRGCRWVYGRTGRRSQSCGRRRRIILRRWRKRRARKSWRSGTGRWNAVSGGSCRKKKKIFYLTVLTIGRVCSIIKQKCSRD